MYLLGYDIGSSSIKAALVRADTGATVASVQSPETEMDMLAPLPGWAEQHPDTWWHNLCLATKKLLQTTDVQPDRINGIGIAYQMHGLVLVNNHGKVLRPAIIWCDGRAVDIGNRVSDEIGHERCLTHLLNLPGNFTASKLGWVKENEPAIYDQIHHILLPGDYIALRLTGEALTTPSGLSEGIFWDFKKGDVADIVLDNFGFDKKLLPPVAPTFSKQGALTQAAADETGLRKGIPVTYRAGDQPNNAMSLNVLEPGEVAATGGTSGVVYGVVDNPVFDPQSRVNSFLHVNHTSDKPRIGVLLCINGAGSQYAWVKKNLAGQGSSYGEMELSAARISAGSDGLCILPFGNGAERMLGNQDIGSKILNLHFNHHSRAHLYRAALEGIAFSFVYGMEILKNMGLNVQVIRVGNDNLFQSPIFSSTISNLMGSRIELIATTGAIGAAKAAGVATGYFPSVNEAMKGGMAVKVYEPTNMNGVYAEAYHVWARELEEALE